MDIRSWMHQSGKHDTLLAAFESANMADALVHHGPLTIFAPTDDAFAALNEDMLAELSQDVDRLRWVLRCHVAEGYHSTRDMISEQIIPTVAGLNLVAVESQFGVCINEALITQADQAVDDGLIQVIDTVLLAL